MMYIKIVKVIVAVISIVYWGSSSAGGPACQTGIASIIIDNTETSSITGIAGNLGFRCEKKSSTAIDDGYGGNAINISDFQVLQRVSAAPAADKLQLFVGKSNTTVTEFNINTVNQFDFFSAGKHLFDLDRLRTAADWITANVTPDAGVPAGSYGTISMQQFLANIANDVTMYGIVRVVVPLEAGNSTSTLNALNQTVLSSSLYGFCTTTTGLCSCAPTDKKKKKKGGSTANNLFKSIVASSTICGQTLGAKSKIKVKGSLFWDFVDSVDGHSLALAELPFVPRDLYFKVEIPIMVNWAHDGNDDGIMDNMDLVAAYTFGGADNTTVTPAFSFSDVPAESKNYYKYTTGSTLTSSLFASLDPATKYHMMLPSGYAGGWAEAFDKLNITADQWKSIPGLAKPFRVPAGVSGVMTINDISSKGFEDIPTYLYSGGLIDMHNHVNVSGLVYVPQGLELEAKDANITRQYISGAVIVRDTFYIEADVGTITIISADPKSYSTVRRSPSSLGTGASAAPDLIFDPAAFEGGTDVGGGGGGGTPAGGGAGAPGNINWQEIHPQ